MVSAEEALAIILFLVGFKGKKKPPPPPGETQPEACVRLGGRWDPVELVCVFTAPPKPDEPDLPEGCGPKPTVTFQEAAGYWWQPATDAVGWNANVRDRRPDSSVILSSNEAFNQTLQNWYKCERVTDPIRIITQFI